MPDLVVTRARVISFCNPQPCFDHAYISIQGGRVGEIREGDPPREWKSSPALDAGGRVVTPGLVNVHTHLYSALARGTGPRGEAPANFSETLERLWWRLDKALTPEDILISGQVGLLDCLRGGVTTVIDHHASPNAIPGSLDPLSRAFREIGLRGSLCYEVSDREGEEKRKEGIAENIRWIKSCAPGGMLAGHFGLHASFTVADTTVDDCREAMADLPPCGFHLHVAEDRADRAHSLELGDRGVVHRLHRLGVLGRRTIAAHAIHVSDEELALLAESGTAVAHNPQSNMNNCVGHARVRQMMQRGVLVGIGSDGMTGAILQEVKAAFLLMRHVAGDPRVGWQELPGIFEQNQQEIAARAGHPGAGKLAPGGPADLVIWDYLPPTPVEAATRWGHILFGLAVSRPATVVVAGRVALREGKVTGLDEEAVLARARELASRLWQRM